MVERHGDCRRSDTIDILDRVLDTGIVIDGGWRISVGGLDLISINGRAVVASIDTCVRHDPVAERTAPHPSPELAIVNRPAVVAGPSTPPAAPTRRVTRRRVADER